jgi:hypothetical protein
MRIAFVAVVLAVDDGAGDERAGGKGGQREPIIAMAAIAAMVFAIAAMAVPVAAVIVGEAAPAEIAVAEIAIAEMAMAARMTQELSATFSDLYDIDDESDACGTNICAALAGMTAATANETDKAVASIPLTILFMVFSSKGWLTSLVAR